MDFKIRNLKKVSIIAIIVSSSLQKSLVSAHPIIDEDGWLRYISLDKDINAYWEGSAYALQKASSEPKKVTAASIIASAEIIEGLAFQSLETTLESARRDNASSDVAWITEWMHDEWLKEQSKEEESHALQ